MVDPKRNGTKEKRLPDEAHPVSRSFRDFPTRHPWLGRKTPPIHGRRPPGLACAGPSLAGEANGNTEAGQSPCVSTGAVMEDVCRIPAHERSRPRAGHLTRGNTRATNPASCALRIDRRIEHPTRAHRLDHILRRVRSVGWTRHAQTNRSVPRLVDPRFLGRFTRSVTHRAEAVNRLAAASLLLPLRLPLPRRSNDSSAHLPDP